MKKHKPNHKLQLFLLVKEIILMTLLVISLACLALEHFERFTEEQLQMVEVYEFVLAFIFMGDFIFEWYHAKDRRQYWRHNWIFLLAAIPLPNALAEYLRAVRFIRLLRLFKIFAHMRYEYNTKLFTD